MIDVARGKAILLNALVSCPRGYFRSADGQFLDHNDGGAKVMPSRSA
jgi:hypothetical protein